MDISPLGQQSQAVYPKTLSSWDLYCSWFLLMILIPTFCVQYPSLLMILNYQTRLTVIRTGTCCNRTYSAWWNGQPSGRCHSMITKCSVMHLGGNNQKFDYFMGSHKLEAVSQEKVLRFWITDNLKPSMQCQNAYSKASRALGLIGRTISFKSKDVLIRLYKTLVRPHLVQTFGLRAWLIKANGATLPSGHHVTDRYLSVSNTGLQEWFRD